MCYYVCSFEGVKFLFIESFFIILYSVFEAERPGCRFSVKQRLGTYFFKVKLKYMSTEL